jgi:phosphate transport system substrate-binding protein
VAIIVNEDNPLTSMTLEQLRGLYLGTVNDWSQLGIGSGPVHLFGRNNNSGTYAYFKETVLEKANYSSNMTELAGNPALLNNVASDPLAIGYVGIGYAKEATGIKILSLSGPGHAAASPLDSEAVISGDYVLSRYLYFYINGTAAGLMRDYLAWVLDWEGGQGLAEEIGFYALPDEIIEQQRRELNL